MLGKQQGGLRPREAGEDQSRHQRHRQDAGEELDRRDEVAIMRLRMHVAIAGRRERLDAEIEIIDVVAAWHIRNRLVGEPEIAGPIEQPKPGVEQQKQNGCAGDEGRP
jgi:hypothetical protein